MIPKIIHYCWFGKNPLPELAMKCIESWKKNLKEYEIIRWDENNFDCTINNYVKEAYQNKKYAFVTDYVRLYALYNYGGIYMDTDVEVLKNIDIFLENDAFSGFENETQIPTGIMASVKGHEAVKDLLDYYKDKSFIKENGKFDLTTNVVTITNYFNKYGFNPNNKKQILRNFTFYPKDFFCPKDNVTGKINLTENTYTIHHFNGSWADKEQILYLKTVRKYGKKRGEKLLLLRYILKHPIMSFKKLINKIKERE